MNLHRLLLTGAAVGGVLAILGVAVVAMAWFYPQWLVTEQGPGANPDALQVGLNVQLMGTLIGLMTAAAGMGLAVFCFNQLAKKRR
jgi:hypothetical protein